MWKEIKSHNDIAEYLDERWGIIEFLERSDITESLQANKSYYEGVVKGLELSGYSWVRDENGKHKVWR